MQFVVPQFIDVENKVLGPLSVRQFIIFMVTAGIIVILNQLMDFFYWVFAAIIVLCIAFMFAFVKINGRGFHYFLLSLFQTYRRPQLKIWQKDDQRYLIKKEEPILRKKGYVPLEKGLLTSSRLAQLALVVDTGGAYRYEEESGEKLQSNITTLEI